MDDLLNRLRRTDPPNTDGAWYWVNPDGSEAADEIERLLADLAKVEQENVRLRAALANSKSPCVYCSLPADEWAKCPSGFPGCDRADDAMGCPELGARLEAEELRAALATARRDALEEAARLVEYRDPSNPFAPRNDREQILAAAIRALVDKETGQ